MVFRLRINNLINEIIALCNNVEEIRMKIRSRRVTKWFSQLMIVPKVLMLIIIIYINSNYGDDRSLSKYV